MWRWTLNRNEMPGCDVVVGNCPRERTDVRRLHEETGAGAILWLQHDECHSSHGITFRSLAEEGAALGIEMVRSPLRDFDPHDQRTNLPGAVRTLNHLLAAGLRVYVHRTAGINRAPLVFLAEQVFMRHRAVDEALAFLRRHRPGAAPYMDALHGCREDLSRRQRERVARRAYRHYEQGGPDPDENCHRAERAVLAEAIVRLPSAWRGGRAEPDEGTPAERLAAAAVRKPDPRRDLPLPSALRTHARSRLAGDGRRPGAW